MFERVIYKVSSSVQGSRKWYSLVLKGYQMEKLPLCKPSTNVEVDQDASHYIQELRKLGQTIAENLNINYFDEANISKHHVIRHFRYKKV